MSDTFEGAAPPPAPPDSIVALVACPWERPDRAYLEAVFAEHWTERAELGADPDRGAWSIEGEEHAAIAWFREGPVPELGALVGTSAEPLAPAEYEQLRTHRSTMRLVCPAGRRLGRRAAKRVSQALAALVEAGAPAVMLPALATLHGPRVIRRATMDLHDLGATAQLFVGAFHDGDWMRTRGLTAFGLPELEVNTRGHGRNGAYFTLMDTAATMLAQMARFPDGASLQIGPAFWTIGPGPIGIAADETLPVNGAFGVMTLSPGAP